MSPAESLSRYIADHIPIAQQMGVWVSQLTNESIELSVPLQPNLNHRETAFGGSLSAVAILAGWGLLHYRCRVAGMQPTLVVQRSETEFRKPVVADFTASARLPDENTWNRFHRCWQRRGKARLSLTTQIQCQETLAAEHHGSYVAIHQT